MAAPGSDDTDHLSKVEGPTEAPSPEPSAPKRAAPPRRRAGNFLSKLLFSAIALLVVLGGAGYGALIFRDADPRVGIAASYVEDGLSEAQSALDKAQASLAELTGQAPPPQSAKAPARRMLGQIKPAPSPEPSPTPAVEPEKAPEPVAPAPVDAAKGPETPAVAENAASYVRSEAVPEPPHKPVEIAEEPAPAPLPAPAPVAPAPVAAEPARPAAPVVAAEAPDADGFTDRDLISALEGRIDAMSDEIKALREKLDAPKNETRAAPEAEAPKPAPAAVADNAGTTVVVAFALQRELEKGRPFADEIAALSRLNAEPAPAPVLIEYSEKGAPTGEQLRETFLPIAKKLKAHETAAEAHADSGDIAGHLLEGASKLIKVRPSGHAHPESYEGKIEKIEAALAHDDFAAAATAFENLPEHARTEAKAFGETLAQRAEAARAADELLHGAIAALGKK